MIIIITKTTTVIDRAFLYWSVFRVSTSDNNNKDKNNTKESFFKVIFICATTFIR